MLLGKNANIYKNKINSKIISKSLQNINQKELKDENEVTEIVQNINLNNETCKIMNIKNVLNVSQFTRGSLRSLFKNASIMKQNVKKYGKLHQYLKGKVFGLYFDEPSSRTFSSFYVIVKKLGGDVLSLNDTNSSSQKRREFI